MSAILAQLGGNPFNTIVGQKIEQGTDASLASENWALNMEICDIINDTDEGPKDAIKAIRKRLQQNAGKNYSVVMYSLTVLETCVKNCGRRFHLLVTQKDFVLELVKLIGPKNDPPTVVQEKVLSLIQSWADAFRNVSDMQGVVLVYNDLKQKGIEFPMTDMDAMAPIHTPQRQMQTLPRQHQQQHLSHHGGMNDHPGGVLGGGPLGGGPQDHPEQAAFLTRDGGVYPSQLDPPGGLGGGVLSAANPSSPGGVLSPHHHQHPRGSPAVGGVVPVPGVGVPVPGVGVPAPAGPIHLTPEQLAKLRSELDVVQGNMKVFGEMLSELTPGNCGEHPSDLELLKDLKETCRAMQGRLVQLIDRVANEEVTNELLRVNDEMNNLFIRYERFEKKSAAIITAGSQGQETAVKKPQPQQDNSQPLIDLGSSESDHFLLRNSHSNKQQNEIGKQLESATAAGALSSQLANLGFGSESATSRVSKLNSVTTLNSRTPASGGEGGPLEHSDEFDMFAQSRNTSYEQSKISGSTYADNSVSLDQVSTTLGTLAQTKGLLAKEGQDDEFYQLQKEQDFDEMEEWLMEKKPTATKEQQPQQQGPESISSSEFDRFLAERAAAADNLPDASLIANNPSATSSPATTTPSTMNESGVANNSGRSGRVAVAVAAEPINSRRAEQRKEETEKTLFAL